MTPLCVLHTLYLCPLNYCIHCTKVVTMITLSPYSLVCVVEFVLCDGVRERSDWALHDTVETMKQQLALNHNLSLADITVSYNGKVVVM